MGYSLRKEYLLPPTMTLAGLQTEWILSQCREQTMF